MKSLIKNNKKFKGKRVANFFDEAGWKDNWKGSNLGGSISGIVGGLGTIAEASMANAETDTTAADNAIQAVNSYKPNTSSLDAIASGHNTAIKNYNQYDYTDFSVGTGEGWSNIGKAALAGAQAGSSLGIWGTIGGTILGGATAGLSWLGGIEQAKEDALNKNYEQEMAAKSASMKTNKAISDNIESDQNSFLRELRAYGGPIYNFSGDFSNGLTFINEGGTHEQNPFEGVQLGVDPQGVPNLVEEGEIVYNDYVFSNRLKPTKKQLENNGLNKKYEGWTFAKIVEDLQKESANNPNDFISQNTLEDMMNIMINMQEEVRAKRGNTGMNKMRAFGGNIFSGKTDTKTGQSTVALPSSFTSQIVIPESESLTAQNKALLDWGASPEGRAYVKSRKLFTDLPTIQNNPSFLRYTPVITSTGELLNNIFTEPDYTNANAGLVAMQNIAPIKANTIGGEKVYRPTDKNQYINKAMNNSRALASAIQNNAVTASQALTGLTNLGYNTQIGLGDYFLKSDEQDFMKDLQIGQFNTGIKQYNANQLTSAAQANQQLEYNKALEAARAGQLREGIDSMRNQAINSNIEAISESLAGVGTEAEQRGWLQMLINSYALQAPKVTKKCGGRLLTKKRK